MAEHLSGDYGALISLPNQGHHDVLLNEKMEDEMIGLEGEIEFMQYHHDRVIGKRSSGEKKGKRATNQGRRRRKCGERQKGIGRRVEASEISVELDILKMERDAEKKAKEVLFNAFGTMDEKAKRLEKDLKVSEEEQQAKENVWKAQKEALEAQVRKAQARLKRIKDIAQQCSRIEDSSTSDETPTTTRKHRASYSAPTTQQGGPEGGVQHDGSDDAQGDNEGPSTSSQTNASGKRKCLRREELLVETEPPARRQQAKVNYSGAQGRQEPSKQRK
ncbi:hypothetical protein B9Z55_028836 [Caenorhabditis nigoni]|uniref:Uncharacterized protein n=2 Tax=Caenorhabditis nigoni TaxID=1611254 RepID=A0A2G5S9R3_9PELO|nr:hypothetical protein B9Z55_028836 [Caenorhabditis nigoni]